MRVTCGLHAGNFDHDDAEMLRVTRAPGLASRILARFAYDSRATVGTRG
jgi:hypothetical protein